jgi:ADP-ribose pyrophosphatase
MTKMGREPSAVGVGLVTSEAVYRGRIVKLSLDTVNFPDGSQGQMEMIRHAGASAVLPIFGTLDDVDPDVVLVRQYRYATDGFIYEVPAGMPDREGEPWAECARRELEEETGLVSGRLVRLTQIYTTPGFTDEVIRLFVALELEEGSVCHDDDEFIEVKRMPFSEALQMVRDGRIVDCKSVATLLFAAQFVIGKGDFA